VWLRLVLSSRRKSSEVGEQRTVVIANVVRIELRRSHECKAAACRGLELKRGEPGVVFLYGQPLFEEVLYLLPGFVLVDTHPSRSASESITAELTMARETRRLNGPLSRG